MTLKFTDMQLASMLNWERDGFASPWKTEEEVRSYYGDLKSELEKSTGLDISGYFGINLGKNFYNMNFTDENKAVAIPVSPDGTKKYFEKELINLNFAFSTYSKHYFFSEYVTYTRDNKFDNDKGAIVGGRTSNMNFDDIDNLKTDWIIDAAEKIELFLSSRNFTRLHQEDLKTEIPKSLVPEDFINTNYSHDRSVYTYFDALFRDDY